MEYKGRGCGLPFSKREITNENEKRIIEPVKKRRRLQVKKKVIVQAKEKREV